MRASCVASAPATASAGAPAAVMCASVAKRSWRAIVTPGPEFVITKATDGSAAATSRTTQPPWLWPKSPSRAGSTPIGSAGTPAVPRRRLSARRGRCHASRRSTRRRPACRTTLRRCRGRAGLREWPGSRRRCRDPTAQTRNHQHGGASLAVRPVQRAGERGARRSWRAARTWTASGNRTDSTS